MFGGEDKMFGVGLTKFLVSVESTNRDLIEFSKSGFGNYMYVEIGF